MVYDVSSPRRSYMTIDGSYLLTGTQIAGHVHWVSEVNLEEGICSS